MSPRSTQFVGREEDNLALFCEPAITHPTLPRQPLGTPIEGGFSLLVAQHPQRLMVLQIDLISNKASLSQPQMAIGKTTVYAEVPIAVTITILSSECFLGTRMTDLLNQCMREFF